MSYAPFIKEIGRGPKGSKPLSVQQAESLFGDMMDGRVREALLGGFAYSRILENHGQRMLDRNFKPGFKAWMHQKDMNIVLQEAHRLGLMLPTSAASAQLFNAMVGSGLGEEDSVAALKLLEGLSGD